MGYTVDALYLGFCLRIITALRMGMISLPFLVEKILVICAPIKKNLCRIINPDQYNN